MQVWFDDFNLSVDHISPHSTQLVRQRAAGRREHHSVHHAERPDSRPTCECQASPELRAVEVGEILSPPHTPAKTIAGIASPLRATRGVGAILRQQLVPFFLAGRNRSCRLHLSMYTCFRVLSQVWLVGVKLFGGFKLILYWSAFSIFVLAWAVDYREWSNWLVALNSCAP